VKGQLLLLPGRESPGSFVKAAPGSTSRRRAGLPPHPLLGTPPAKMPETRTFTPPPCHLDSINQLGKAGVSLRPFPRFPQAEPSPPRAAARLAGQAGSSLLGCQGRSPVLGCWGRSPRQGCASWHRPGMPHPQAFASLQHSPNPKLDTFTTSFFHASSNFLNPADPNFSLFIWVGFFFAGAR